MSGGLPPGVTDYDIDEAAGASDPEVDEGEPEPSEHLYDVISVRQSDLAVRVMARDLNAQNAEAEVAMAVARRGVDTHFFKKIDAGTMRDGDKP